jgi:hypothetical protein
MKFLIRFGIVVGCLQVMGLIYLLSGLFLGHPRGPRLFLPRVQDVAAASAEDPANSVSISRKEYGEDWPFTVEQGTLRVEHRRIGGRDLVGVVFEAEGQSYALNGWAAEWGLGDDIHPILALDPRLKGYGVRKDIGPIVNRGLSL